MGGGRSRRMGAVAHAGASLRSEAVRLHEIRRIEPAGCSDSRSLLGMLALRLRLQTLLLQGIEMVGLDLHHASLLLHELRAAVS